MSSLKRKADELEDSDEEEASYGKQILPVANLPNDFNEEPMDGLQYLFTVRRAARQMPDVVRAPNPYEQPEPSVPPPFQGNKEQKGVDISHLPSEEWRELFEYRFLNFRKNLNQPTIHVGPTNDGPRRLMPEKKDRDMWWAFLEGRPESEWTPVPKSKGKSRQPYQRTPAQGMRAWIDERQPQHVQPGPIHGSLQNNDEGEVEQELRVDPAESLPSPAGTPVPLEYLEEIMQPSSSSAQFRPVPALPESRRREPTTTLLKSIDERTALHLLMYFTHWIQLYLKAPELGNHLPTESHARWIFALLSRVEDYLCADDMNLLRNLARACLGLLGELKRKQGSSHSLVSGSMGEISCWLIVTIVADIWKQRDLWHDAEGMLSQASS